MQDLLPRTADGDAHQKTIDVYVARIAEDSARTIALTRGTLHLGTDMVERTLARLHESRANVAAHLTGAIGDMAALADTDMQVRIEQDLAPLSGVTFTADVAIARLRAWLNRGQP